MNRRKLLQRLVSTSLSSAFLLSRVQAQSRLLSRIRPGDARWPSQADWDRLNRDIGGQLSKVRSPLAACVDDPQGPACADIFRLLKNPYAVGDDVALTEKSRLGGCVDLAAEHLCCRRTQRGGYRRRGELCPRA